MRTAIPRAVMTLATAAVPSSRREWALAMEAELDSAIDNGRPLSFALGCLLGSWRELPAHEEGRFALASHLVAVGFLVPSAVLLAWQTLAATVPAGNGFLNGGNVAALPSLALASLLLAFGHVRLGWALLDCDWSRCRRWAMLDAALATALVTVAGALFLWEPRFLVHAATTLVELAAVATLVRWHEELPSAAQRLSTA